MDLGVARASLERLAKWRALFTGWQLGTRLKGDPEGDAVRDHREVTIILRAEVSALAQLLIEHGVFSEDDWWRQLAVEADMLSEEYERRFPGVRATGDGLDIDLAKAREWMNGWKP